MGLESPALLNATDDSSDAIRGGPTPSPFREARPAFETPNERDKNMSLYRNSQGELICAETGEIPYVVDERPECKDCGRRYEEGQSRKCTRCERRLCPDCMADFGYDICLRCVGELEQIEDKQEKLTRAAMDAVRLMAKAEYLRLQGLDCTKELAEARAGLQTWL